MNHLFIDIKGHVCPFSICSWRSLEVYDVSCVDLEETVNFWFLSTCFLWKLATKLVSFSHSDFLWGLFKGLSFVHVDRCVLCLFSKHYIFLLFLCLRLSIALWRWQLFHLTCTWKLHSFACKVPGTCTFMSHSGGHHSAALFPFRQTKLYLPVMQVHFFLFCPLIEKGRLFVFFLFVHAFYIQDGSNYTFFFFLLLAFLCV